MGFLRTVRVPHENLTHLLDLARTACRVARDEHAVCIRPTTSGLIWRGAWCLYHNATVYVKSPTFQRGELVGLMDRLGELKPMPGIRTDRLPTAPYVVKWAASNLFSGVTFTDLLDDQNYDDVTRAIGHAQALVAFEISLDTLLRSTIESPLFNGGPEPTVFLVACLARFLRSMVEICAKDESKWRPDTKWSGIADEIAKDFFNGPWDELTDLRPDAIDYEDAGAFMVHQFAACMGGDELPRLSHVVDQAAYEALVDVALPFFIKHWKLN